MKINQVIEQKMTYDEQVELTRLEDECSDADDSLWFAQNTNDWKEHVLDPVIHINNCVTAVIVTEHNLNKYIAQMTNKYSL